MDADSYLELIEGWDDPNPDPIIEIHEGIHIVRDDLLGIGSKVRFIDYFIGHEKKNQEVKEWCYASPATGFAQISLSAVCAKYGKKAVLFQAKRKMENLHEYQRKCLDLLGDIRWITFGMLSVTQSRARKYCEEDPKHRRILPSGFDHDTVIASIIKVARNLPIQPKEIWTVGGSGTINKGLRLAFPDAEVHMVQVGYEINDPGDAIVHRSEYKFEESIKEAEMPPFPSAPTYDAKCWKHMMEWYENHEKKGDVLFWNVA